MLTSQNIFWGGKCSRNISLNAHFFFIFNCKRDVSQVRRLAYQVFSGVSGKAMMEVYNHIHSVGKFQYLCLNLHPSFGEEREKMLSRIIPGEGYTSVYIVK